MGNKRKRRMNKTQQEINKRFIHLIELTNKRIDKIQEEIELIARLK